MLGRFILTHHVHGLPEKLMRRLQPVQNATARMHNAQLHWLPARRRVNFKVAVLVFQSLIGQAPTYLADDCQLTADASARRLCSADMAKCVVHGTYNNFGDQCFAAAGPRL